MIGYRFVFGVCQQRFKRVRLKIISTIRKIHLLNIFSDITTICCYCALKNHVTEKINMLNY